MISRSVRSLAVLALPAIALAITACGGTSEPETVEVVKEVEVIKEVPVEVIVEKVVEVPVEVVKEVPVEVVVEKVVEVPVEVVKEVPVEVVVEKVVEVPVEVVVVKEVPVPTPTPTPITASNVVWTSYAHAYSHLPALGFTEGITLTSSENESLDISKHRGALVLDNLSSLSALHAFIYSGGNAAIFIFYCNAEILQADFGITCASMSRNADFRIKGSGELFAPFWDDLVISMPDTEKSIVQLFSGQSDLTCISATDEITGLFCTALYGKVGAGNVIFMIGTGAYGCTYPTRDCPETIMNDYYIHNYDHKQAASRLLHWLVGG